MKVCLSLGLMALMATSFAQIRLPGGGDINLPKIPLESLSKILSGENPLTTKFEDSYPTMKYFDGWQPVEFTPITAEMRTGEVGWRLEPGAYRIHVDSFCAKGYTSRPSEGDGYLGAPWKGQRHELLRTIARRYSAREAVDQRGTQLLIWGILARCKPSEIKGEAREAMLQLLTPAEIASLEVNAMGIVEDRLMGPLMGQVDSALRPLYQAQNQLRRGLNDANRPFEELERLMMLEPDAQAKTLVPGGRWNWNPKGYAYRWDARGYTNGYLDIVVPHKASVTLDGKGRVVRMESQPGVFSEVVYNDDVPPQAHPENARLVAYPISRVRLVDATHDEWFDVAGYIFNLQPETSLDVLWASIDRPAQGNWFTRWRERADAIQEHRERMEEMRERAEWVDRITNPEADSEGFLDRGHYQDGLEEAITGDTSSRLGWIAEHHQRQNSALLDAIRALESLGTDADPTEDLNYPGRSGGQIIISSGRGR